jgi:hypothetical protein
VELRPVLGREGHVGEDVKLVVSDAHEGLKAAVAKVLSATWQRCRVHFMRNALDRSTECVPGDRITDWLDEAFEEAGRLEISLTLSDDAEPKRLDLPWSAPASRRKREIVGPPAEGSERRLMRAEARARLLEAIAKARLWLDGLIAGTFASTAEIARHERCSERAVRITLSLAFLAPAIVRAAVEGRLPYGLNTLSFSELPILWEEQLHLAS